MDRSEILALVYLFLPNTVYLSGEAWAPLWEVAVLACIRGSCSVGSFGVMVSGVKLLIELVPSIFLSRKNAGSTKVVWACAQHFHGHPFSP